MDIFWQRVIRAAKLDPNLYEEVEKDTRAMPQAITVVLLSALAAGIGSISKIGMQGIFIGAVIGLIAWYVWAMLTYYIGTKFLPEPQTKSNLGELLRTIGFSSSPGLIRILGVIAGIERLVFSLAAAWMLVAMIIAVKCALDYKSTWRAVGVCLVGWVVQVLIFTLLFALSGGLKSV
jgi:tetrahydromethanopterin S-methyltransferase subunit G